MKVPQFRKHANGQGFARAGGKNIYFGRHDDAGAYQKYREWLASYLLGDTPMQSLTIGQLVVIYFEWAKTNYVKHGAPTKQIGRIQIALRGLLKLYKSTAVNQFGYDEMERVRDWMDRQGWTRGFVNSAFGCLKTMFKWAGLREHLGMDRALRLAHVPNLKKGKCASKESAKIKAVPRELVMETIPHLGRIPGAMVMTQLHGGMRPIEVCVMRTYDIDTSGPIWQYRPHVHKNEHRDQDRIIRLGPQAIEVLAPFVMPVKVASVDEFCYLFNPDEAAKEYADSVGRKFSSNLPSCGTKRYETASYSQTIRRACERGKLPIWTPLQLRHTRATEIRAKYGPDAARAFLGHQSLNSTEVYAELDCKAADLIAHETG